MDSVCNRGLFSIPSKVEMAKEQEYYMITLIRHGISISHFNV